MAVDLPFNEGIFATLELRCPEGTIVNARPPAPIAAAHMHVALNAADVAMQAVTLALAASPEPGRQSGTRAGVRVGARQQPVVVGRGPTAPTDAYHGASTATGSGGSASIERDGLDLGRNLVGTDLGGSFPDIEILESWYPLLFLERRARQGTEGAGSHRAGGGNQLSFRPHGVDAISGTMFGMRRWLPLPGVGRRRARGVQPVPRPPRRRLGRAARRQRDGHRRCPTATGSRCGCANGGGFGDPLDRPADAGRGRRRRGPLQPRGRGAASTASSSPATAASTRRRRRGTGPSCARPGWRHGLARVATGP